MPGCSYILVELHFSVFVNLFVIYLFDSKHPLL